ncbi:hypothetical protein, partial [Cellulosimicrobium cellulans]|uniref:hypothetical protein n=1 Tax=Cellulosimicrobium cellulans TaxID=1710 RepID=UPI001D15F449
MPASPGTPEGGTEGAGTDDGDTDDGTEDGGTEDGGTEETGAGWPGAASARVLDGPPEPAVEPSAVADEAPRVVRDVEAALSDAPFPGTVPSP